MILKTIKIEIIDKSFETTTFEGFDPIIAANSFSECLKRYVMGINCKPIDFNIKRNEDENEMSTL